MMKVKLLNGTVLIIVTILFAQVSLCAENNEIVVLMSGMEPLEPDATSIKFYVLAENRDTHSAVVGLEVKKCCQQITPIDMECDSMSLHNGLRQEFHPGDKINLTMLYTNRYLYGRKGDCWLRLTSKQKSKGVASNDVKIHFDTHDFRPTPLQKLISVIPGSKIRTCESVDEDPTRGCLPVNCLLKYSGFRSFFNRTERRCQSSPTCHSVPFKLDAQKKPDIILSPRSNRCKHIRDAPHFNDKMKDVEDMTEVAALSYTKYPIKVKCVHGRRNGSEELCICDTGWTSKNFSAEKFNPEIHVYVKCDQPFGDTKPLPSTALIILIGMLILVAILLCIYVPCIYHRYIAHSKIQSLSSDLAAPSSASSDSDDELSIISSSKSSKRGISPTPAPTKSRLVEFSPLAREERTARPVESDKRVLSEGVKHLSYPESFQLKPRPMSPISANWSRTTSYPVSESTSTTTTASSNACIRTRWSVPDTSDSLPCCQDTTCSMVPLKCSLSVDAFPRHTQPCTCSQQELKPLVSVRVHTNDPNRNTVVSLRKFCASDTSLALENVVTFPGPSPQCIAEMATKRWQNELDNFLETLKPEDDVTSLTTPASASSTASTLNEFWSEDKEEEAKAKPRKKSGNELWFQQLVDSLKRPD